MEAPGTSPHLNAASSRAMTEERICRVVSVHSNLCVFVAVAVSWFCRHGFCTGKERHEGSDAMPLFRCHYCGHFDWHVSELKLHLVISCVQCFLRQIRMMFLKESFQSRCGTIISVVIHYLKFQLVMMISNYLFVWVESVIVSACELHLTTIGLFPSLL